MAIKTCSVYLFWVCMQTERQTEQEPKADLRNYTTRIRLLSNFSIVIFILLLAQYLLGMISNLFVVFPVQSASINPLDSLFFSGPYVVLFHLLNGLALGLISIAAVVVSASTRNRRLVAIAFCGLGSILFAGESGIEFILGWYSDDLFSFLMSVGFVLSFLSYFALLWFANEKMHELRIL